jgi:hypothetical protein
MSETGWYRDDETRWADDRYDHRYDERLHGPRVVDRIRNWWHRNVSDPDYERERSDDMISAGHSGWTRDRHWDNYSRSAGSSTFGTTEYNYGGELYGRYRGRGPKNWRRSDERIREDVNEELTRHPDVDASEIDTAVINNEVTLTGTVDSRYEKREAEDCAWCVSGVRDVHNQLRVKQGVESMIASVFEGDR